MFNLRLWNAAIIRYSRLKFRHMYLCGMDYKYFSPHCCKCNSFGCTAAIRWGNAYHGPHSDSLYSGSEHSQFNSPRLVKREAGFPNPRWALIGSNQVWRVNDSPYYREFSVVWWVINASYLVWANQRSPWPGETRFTLDSPRWIELAVLAAWIDAIAMGPVACITTPYCGNTAKTVTFTTVWWKLLIALATKMHVSKFQ